MLERRAMQGLAARHALVGAACAALNVGIVHVGDRVLGWPYLAAALLTCFVTIPVSYVLHRRHSFRLISRPQWTEFSRFLTQQGVQFAAGLALLAFGVEVLTLNPTWSMVLTTMVMWLFGLVSQWFWVFRLAQPDHDNPRSLQR